MAEREPFPTDPADFQDDPRIAYDQKAAAYILEDETTGEWEWLPGPCRWMKTTDDADIQKQAEAYKVQGVDENAPALNPSKKRKDALQDDASSKAAKTAAGATAAASKPARANTAIYVTGLPLDVEKEELVQYFERFGVIQETINDNEKRIKMYYDEDGEFKGEALIVYLRPESLPNVLIVADGAIFYRNDTKAQTSTISVSEADFSHKPAEDEANAAKPKDDGAKGKKKPSKAQVKAKSEEMNRRLADWSDDDTSTMKQTSSRFDKVVVLKHMFTAEDTQSAEDMEDIKEDVEEEAEKFGTVKNVTLFDLEDDGVITVRFSNATAAQACAQAFSKRKFDDRQVEASIATGDEKFKKTRRNAVDREAEEAKRLEDYSKMIDGDSANTGDK